MNVQAEVSLYPLRTVTLMESIDRFLEHLRHSGLRVEIGPMSSRLTEEMIAVEGIIDTTTLIAFRQYSKHDLENMFGLGME